MHADKSQPQSDGSHKFRQRTSAKARLDYAGVSICRHRHALRECLSKDILRPPVGISQPQFAVKPAGRTDQSQPLHVNARAVNLRTTGTTHERMATSDQTKPSQQLRPDILRRPCVTGNKHLANRIFFVQPPHVPSGNPPVRTQSALRNIANDRMILILCKPPPSPSRNASQPPGTHNKLPVR